MKNADQPITPTVYRKIGENEYRIASEKDIRENAYLSTTSGLTKREYFALHLLQGLCVQAIPGPHNSPERQKTELEPHAIELADELLKQHEK